MNPPPKLKIDFGQPHHGWMLVSLEYGEFSLKLDVSNVPSDPMEQLLEALAGLHKGINYPDPIIWHLEPYCYYAQFEKVRNNYKIKISESEEFKGPARFVCEFEGDYQQMILPFYRAMKRFYSYNYQPPAWNEPDQKRIVKLKELVQSKKTNKSDS